MGKGHFTKFTLLHAVIIHIPARFLGHTASMLQQARWAMAHPIIRIATGIKRSKLNALSISCRRTHALCTRTCRTNGLRQLECTRLEWQSVTQVTSPSIQEKISAFPSESLDLGIVHASQNGLKTFPFFTTMLKRMLYSVIFA